jgi:hypothetical protein
MSSTCDEGFSVEVLGRVGMRYSERGRTMYIDSEVLAGPHGVGMWRSSIKSWDPPDSDEPVDEATRDRIIEHIRRAFLSQGWPLLEVG